MMLRAILPTAAAALAAAAVACGGDDDRLTLTTPAEKVGAPPIATPTAQPSRKRRQREPTQRDAERLRPVLDGWARAVRQGDLEAAARYFRLPVIVAETTAIKVETRAQLRDFLNALPCGARLVEVGHSGPYVVGTFRLTERPGHQCDGPGALARVGFVVRRGKITEWRRLPDDPSAQPSPAPADPAPADGQKIA
jgi:hypothetical protein